MTHLVRANKVCSDHVQTCKHRPKSSGGMLVPLTPVISQHEEIFQGPTVRHISTDRCQREQTCGRSSERPICWELHVVLVDKKYSSRTVHALCRRSPTKAKACEGLYRILRSLRGYHILYA
jgi:hypothetical protein